MIKPGTLIADLSDEQRDQYSRDTVARLSPRVAMLAYFDRNSGEALGKLLAKAR